MTGYEMLVALRQLGPRVLAEPVVVSNCDAGGDSFFPAMPFIGERVDVVGMGNRRAIVLGRALQPPPPQSTRHYKPGCRGAYNTKARRIREGKAVGHA